MKEKMSRISLRKKRKNKMRVLKKRRTRMMNIMRERKKRSKKRMRMKILVWYLNENIRYMFLL